MGGAWYLGQHPRPTVAADQPNPTLSYQGQLTDSGGTASPDRIHTVAFSIYSAASGGTALWSETWATSTMFQTALTAQAATSSVSLSYTEPTSTSADTNVYLYQTLYNLTRQDQVTVTGIDTGANTVTITPTAKTWESGDYITTRLVTFDGLFSVRLPATSSLEAIFNVASSTRLYLGVNFNGDGEMQPRKQVTYAPLAINALYLGGVPSTSFARLDVANTFATTTFTGSPAGTGVGQGGLYVNPSAPGAEQTLLGVANNGGERLRVDAEGDVFASGTLSVLGVKTTSSNPLLLYGGSATSFVQVGSALPTAYFGLSATSSDDLLVAGELAVGGAAHFTSGIFENDLEAYSSSFFFGSSYFEGPPGGTGVGQGGLYVNPASPGANQTLLGVANYDSERLRVDAEGDVFASGTVRALGLTTTSTNPLLLYGGSATSFVQVGSVLPAAYFGLYATSSDDLLVAGELAVGSSVRFSGTVDANDMVTFQQGLDVYGTLAVEDSATFTGPTGGAGVGDGGLFVNPASPAANQTLLGAASNGSERLRVDAEGDVFASGTVRALGLTTTSTNPLLLYGGSSTSFVQVGSVLPAAYVGLPATSSNDLLVAGELTVSHARFDNFEVYTLGVFDSDLEVYGTSYLIGPSSFEDTSTFFATSTYVWGGLTVAGVNITNSGATGSKVLQFSDGADQTPWLELELDGTVPIFESSANYFTFRNSITFDSSGDVYYIPNGSTIGNGTPVDSVDFRDDANSAAVGNFNVDLNQAFPILSSPNTATTSVYDTLLVSSTDSFYIRSIVNTANVAGRLAFDDANDELLLDVNTTSTAVVNLDVAVRLDDNGGSSFFRIRDSDGAAVWSVDSDGTIGTGGSDVAERYPSGELLLPGDVVAADPDRAGYIRLATGASGESILGVVSTKPAIVLGYYGEGEEALGYDVALVGRVPVRVTDENGPIAVGDLLTLGAEPGTAVRRVAGGVAIGTALEAMASGTGAITTFINVASQPDLLEVVPSASRSADLRVYRFAPYAGTIEVARLVVTETIEVRGSLKVAGSLQLEGALLTEFWDASGGRLRVGDAAAIVGPNEVDRTWADLSPARPAIGLVAEVVPPEEVGVTTTAEYLALLAQRGQLADPAQLRRLRVAVGGTLAGFTGLQPGTRYYLATQPLYSTSGTSSQEALAAEAPAAVGTIQQLLGIARDERSLLLFVSPQYQINEVPPVVVVPVPPPPPEPEPEPEPELEPIPTPDPEVNPEPPPPALEP